MRNQLFSLAFTVEIVNVWLGKVRKARLWHDSSTPELRPILLNEQFSAKKDYDWHHVSMGGKRSFAAVESSLALLSKRGHP